MIFWDKNYKEIKKVIRMNDNKSLSFFNNMVQVCNEFLN